MAANSTFEALALEWIEIRAATWAQATAKRTIGALELRVFPVFGWRLYTEILPIEGLSRFLQSKPAENYAHVTAT